MTYRAPSLRTLAATAFGALLCSVLLAFARPVVMTLDGKPIHSDVAPVTTINQRVFVPLRSVADALGAHTTAEDKSGHITVVRGNRALRLRVGETHATLNGQPLELKHAPFRVRGRVMVSLKTVADAFDVRVNYDPRTSRIELLTN